jgi:hypothetical protein
VRGCHSWYGCGIIAVWPCVLASRPAQALFSPPLRPHARIESPRPPRPMPHAIRDSSPAPTLRDNSVAISDRRFKGSRQRFWSPTSLGHKDARQYLPNCCLSTWSVPRQTTRWTTRSSRKPFVIDRKSCQQHVGAHEKTSAPACSDRQRDARALG